MSSREPFTEKSESDSSIKLNTQTRRQVPFYGTLEKTQMASQKENQNTLNRKAAVRQQENELARQKIEQAKKKQQKNREQEEQNQTLEQIIRLRKEAEELVKAKALAEEEAGKAHRAAEQSRLEKEEKDRQRREANQRASDAAKKRSNAASAAFKEEDEALNGAERKRLENLNKLRDEAQEYGRKKGADYREELKNRPEEEVEEYDVYKNYEKNISRKLLRTGPSDFTKSHVHNAIVVSHQDEVGQPSGFEAAEAENKKTETRKLEFTATRDDQRQKSLDRWQKAHEKEKNKKEMENFNKEMERLQKAKNEIKVNQGKQYPEMQTKPATKLLNNARIQKESEKAFEDVFMKPDRKGVSEGNIPTEKELPPKSSFVSKKKSTLKNGSGKSYNFESERSPKSGYGSNTQRTNEDGTLTQTIREGDTYGSQEKADANVFKSEALTNTVSGGAQYSGYEESYENERPDERKYPQNLHESTSSASSNPYTAQQERKQQTEKPWKNARNKSQDLASKEPEVEIYVQNKKPEPQRNVYQQEGSPERSLEYSNQSSPSKEETKSYAAVSFGEKKPTSEWNTGHLETANLKPESLQRPFDYSYQQQQQQLGKEKANVAPSNSKVAREESRVEEKSQKDEVQEQIRGYIQEQEAFLKKYENERQKLSEKVRAPQASSAPSNPAESMSRSNQRQERQERQQPGRQKLLAQENDPEEEAIMELQKKTNALLSRFMAPGGRRDSDSEDERAPESEEESEGEMQSSQQYGQSIGQRFKQSNNFTESQSSVGYRREPRQEDTPERNPRFNPRRQGFSSPSDLDYSVSDRDRSEKKSLAETMDYPKDSQNEYTQSFGQRRFNATETFGKRGDSTEKVQKQNKGKIEQQKGWKMEFNFDSKEDQGREQGAKEERRSEQTRKSEQIVIEDEGREPNLAELFQRKKKKMMEKYEHQREQEHQREEVKEQKPTRTKEEILKQRKAMMQYKGPQNPKAATQGAPSSNNNDERGRRQFVNPFTGEKGSGKEPNPELLDRLAFGKKATVNKKDMHALTSKNYQMLPEVKKKKELEQKKEDMKRRQENVKKLEQERRTNSKSRK